MVFFITFLRAICACIITNSHYTGVYPTDLIANGGLIGDILFFAISGYCLYNVKKGFFSWYGKRIYRVYVPVIIITLVYMLLGFYSLQKASIIEWYVYPTYYHFVASIVLLYIPFYFVMKIDVLRNHLVHIMVAVAVLWLAVYILFCDKTTYHIDNVYNPMIRFLFFESMLLGAWFRQNDHKGRNINHWYNWVAMVVVFVLYFASKMIFSKYQDIAFWQFTNQILIFALLYFIFVAFAGIDDKLSEMPVLLKKIVGFIAQMTLEIYIVQYVLLDLLRNVAGFPLNWFILTASILLVAFALHMTCKGIYALVDIVISKLKKKQT